MGVYINNGVLHRVVGGKLEARPISKIISGPDDIKEAYEAFLGFSDSYDDLKDGWQLMGIPNGVEILQHHVDDWGEHIRVEVKEEPKLKASHLTLVK